MRESNSTLVIAPLLVSASPGNSDEGPTCASWSALSANNRFIVIGSVLEERVGRPETSKRAACLWTISEQIVDHTTEICARDGGLLALAARLALDSAINFCDSR